MKIEPPKLLYTTTHKQCRKLISGCKTGDFETGANPTNFVFLRFPIFAVKLECLYQIKKNFVTMKWPSLTTKSGKIMCLQRKNVW